MELSVFVHFLLAIALWWLIGTERELPWKQTKPTGPTWFWGIRTFASISFFGSITAWFDFQYGWHIWVLFGAILSWAFILLSYGYSSFGKDRMGATSEYAALITYFIGVIAMMGQYITAVILSIFLLLLLSAKEYFAHFKTRFSRQELGDSLKFAVIALVILPLLPNEKYSLLDMANWFQSGWLSWVHPVLSVPFFNPYSIWFFVVVMAGVEYAGFLLGKTLWDKSGILASGAVWGLISSTATTVAMTRKSKEHPEHRSSYAVATLLASSIMFLRVMVVAVYIYPPIITSIVIPGCMMFLGLVFMMGYYFLTSRHEITPISVEEKRWTYESPFQLIPALQFAWLILVIKFIAILGKIYQDIVPQTVSNYFLGLVSGFADVDAVNFTMSEWAKDGSIPLIIAATTILIAVMSNNTIKASIAYRFGEVWFGNMVLRGFWVSIMLGIITIICMRFVV